MSLSKFFLAFFLLISFSLAAKKTPKWKDGLFTTSASGLQYRIVKPGKGDSVQEKDWVEVELYRYDKNKKALKNSSKNKPVFIEPDKTLEGIRQSIALLKEGGSGYFKIPPALGKATDTLFCFISLKRILHPQLDVLAPESKTPSDSINIGVSDPEQSRYGDSLFTTMKLVDVPMPVSCTGTRATLQAVKFQMSWFENGVQRKELLLYIDCPGQYGKDFFVAGASYVITAIPLTENMKQGKNILNAYSSSNKMEQYYCLRIRKI